MTDQIYPPAPVEYPVEILAEDLSIINEGIRIMEIQFLADETQHDPIYKKQIEMWKRVATLIGREITRRIGS